MARATQSAARKSRGARARRESAGEPRADQSSIEAVDRAARILLALATSPRHTSLIEVANRSGLSKPTAFRLLATLVAEGLATQNSETASYSLGVLPLGLASAALRSFPVRDIARPIMQTMREKVNESVVLAVREGDFRVNIDCVEAINTISQTQQIGVPIPLYAGAASRVFLAAMDDDELEAYLARTPLVSFSDTTIIEREAILGAIAQVRTSGYARSSAEFTAGGHAVACAIRNPAGRAIASLHVSIPRSRASEDLVARCLGALKSGSDALERAIAAAPAFDVEGSTP